MEGVTSMGVLPLRPEGKGRTAKKLLTTKDAKGAKKEESPEGSIIQCRSDANRGGAPPLQATLPPSSPCSFAYFAYFAVKLFSF